MKVLHIGISSTHNLGDVAISKMILSLFARNEVAVEHMDFNFSVVVAQCFQFSSKGANKERESQKDHIRKISNNRLLRVVSRLGRFIFFAPIVFFVFLRKVKGCEKVFIGGGNILMGIEYGFPMQVLSYVVFSRLLNKPVTFLCVGAGPFTAPGVKSILRFALSLSDRVICRDSSSKVLIEGVFGPSITDIEVLPDPVLIWPEAQKMQQKYDILFTFMPLFSPTIFPDGDADKAKEFKSCLIELAVNLICQGKRVGVLVTDPGVDLAVSEGIVSKIRDKTGVQLQVDIPANPDQMAALVGSAAIVFSTRMHGAIMALSQAVPALCVCWQPKIKGLYTDLGLAELLVQVDSSGCFSLQEVQEAITNITENRRLFVQRIGVARSDLEGIYENLWKRL
ncbi:MAG: polysaccharide pyruvyl transferase family protein [Candidatus Polarisedimenticolaceae bacterium]|nr:polysaccharide pyruvyl transferase family protein [Candidatus Polarisedimenticolaceae bacterium]